MDNFPNLIPHPSNEKIFYCSNNQQDLVIKRAYECEITGHLLINELLDCDPTLPFLRTLDVVQDKDDHYLVMERLKGVTLYELFSAGNLSQLEIYQVFLEVWKLLPIRSMPPFRKYNIKIEGDSGQGVISYFEPNWSKDVMVDWDEVQQKVNRITFIDYSLDVSNLLESLDDEVQLFLLVEQDVINEDDQPSETWASIVEELVKLKLSYTDMLQYLEAKV